MEIHTNIPIKNFTTMRLGGKARFMTDIFKTEDIAKIFQNAKAQNLPIFIMGGGSNLIARDEGYNGIILKIKIPGFEKMADDINSTTIKIGAGEDWDSVVKRTVDMSLSGIEAMSAIPGTIGAAPVQNIGAYGQEIADTLISLEAYDTENEEFVNLTHEDCNFSYRKSIFNSLDKGRYIITSITLKLSKNQPTPPFYDSLQKYLDENNIKIYTQQTIRDAVIKIRASKLPDPKIMANSGSFFKNAIAEKWQLDEIKNKYPDIPTYDMGDGKFKIPTGWLIEQAGFKGQLINGIRVYDKNALVLVNESATSYNDLEIAKNQIIRKIRDIFRVEIEQEPNEIQ
jgi:UDP-N-acetylmuramate dehydrogenase